MGTPRNDTTPPAGPRALANRRRILEQASAELLRNPGATMEDIAVAAGIVRRTLYGHFPTREALLDGILDSAFEQVDRALDQVDLGAAPEVAAASITLGLWAVGNDFCLLLRLTDENLRPRVRERLAPVRDIVAGLTAAGQQHGVFADHLPPEVLARILPEVVIALLEAHTDGAWTAEDAAGAAARACLVAAGMTADAATAVVHAARQPVTT